MSESQITGLILVCLAGILAGAIALPIKYMQRFRYEHWALIANIVALVLLPWIFVLTLCPNAITAFSSLPVPLLIKANLFTIAWGIANVMVGICLVRIGVSLTIGLMMSIGMPIGVLLPMILRGTGAFSQAPPLQSPAGYVILAGVVVLMAAIYFTTVAGFGRDRILHQQNRGTTGFTSGLIMTILAGFLQVGLSFAFVYTQADIVIALQNQGANEIASIAGVWAIALPGGALVNILYPVWLLNTKRGWGEFAGNWREIGLGLLMGIIFFSFVILNGKGMLMLGSLGASVGFGVYQALMMITSQVIGFAHGEWRGINGKPRNQIYIALAILLVAVCLMAYGNSLAK
jgi:hypothetical protein